MVSNLKPRAFDLDDVLSFRPNPNAYSRSLVRRLGQEAYEIRFRGLFANEAELSIVAHLVGDSGGSLFNEDNMSIVRERTGAIESMPLLVALVESYQTFDAMQRSVDMNLKGVRAKLVSNLYDRFHHTFDLFGQVVLMELSVLAGADRTSEWAAVPGDVAFDRVALTQHRFALGLTGENAWSRLERHLLDITDAFERAQQPLGYLGAALSERRWRR